ncbi:MAG TPA: FAD-dependent oxidoreductase [Solirubrobacteraceae bacterium]|nr:FAD-dependent oxidoreductase [Solirubrobacteraceae bacterium]
MTYDAVIVGGGHNGVAAAAYLARAGWSCLVLERRDHVGGAAVSERPFAGFDARLSRYAYLVSLLPRRIVDELGLRVRLARRSIASYTPDPRAGAARGLLVGDDEHETRASFERVAGGVAELAAWRRFHAALAGFARRLFPTLTEPLRSRAELRAIVADDELWEMIFERPLGLGLERAFSDDLVRGVILSDALIGTFAAAGDDDLRQNRCFLMHVIGGGTGRWDVPVGGMGAVSDALRGAALRAGAELRTGAEVVAIGDGEVRFRAAHGGECGVGARRILVNVAPAELERLRGRPRAQAEAQPEGAQLKINLLLARLPRLRDASITPERAFAGTLHVNETAAQLQAAYDAAAAGRIPPLPPCEAYCHTLTDRSILGPQLAASGAQALTLFVLHMPARLFAADERRAGAQARAAALRSLDSVLDEPIEDCVLRSADGAPCIEAHTPQDLERELRLPAGHIFHRDLGWPFAEQPEDVGSWGVETDDPAILLCGAGARRGGGVSAIAGRNAAMAALASVPSSPGIRRRR